MYLTTFNRFPTNAFSDFFDEMSRSFFSPELPKKHTIRTDITDNGKEFLLEAELPGFEKSDIAIDIKGDRMLISASKETSSDEKDQAGNIVRRERFCGSFSRSFDVSAIDTESIDAEYKNGVLLVTLPKKEKTLPQARRLEIK